MKATVLALLILVCFKHVPIAAQSVSLEGGLKFPRGGELIENHSRVQIEWNDRLFNDASVRLVQLWNQSSGVWSNIGSASPGAGSLVWYPDLQNGRHYRLRVVADDKMMHSESYFAIVSNDAQMVSTQSGFAESKSLPSTHRLVPLALSVGSSVFNFPCPEGVGKPYRVDVFNQIGEKLPEQSNVMQKSQAENVVTAAFPRQGVFVIIFDCACGTIGYIANVQ